MVDRELIEAKVRKWVQKNISSEELADVKERGMSFDHIVTMVTSIICTRDKVSYPGGHFVKAVVAGDLDGAIARADSNNLRLLRLYVIAKNCIQI